MLACSLNLGNTVGITLELIVILTYFALAPPFVPSHLWVPPLGVPMSIGPDLIVPS